MTPPGYTHRPTRDRQMPADVVCLSHLRWNFVFQRPQHLMTACAHDRQVLFFEEPIRDTTFASVQVERHGRVLVATPHLPAGLDAALEAGLQRTLLDRLLASLGLSRFVLWYYTPMALAFSRHLRPLATVYDCMDELSAFANAPRDLPRLERELFARASLVFTGGHSLYEVKRHLHRNVHAFPSSVDVRHFSAARTPQPDPADQASLPSPRLGFFGVIDERMDLALIDGVAAARPDWQVILIGPVAKIDRGALPSRPNIHYLGQRSYADLPAYLSGWDVALLPFALNDATRFISPTKTPEYLAAGRPVVSTAIRDVVRPYGELGLVRIAEGAEGFVAAVEASLSEAREPRLAAADALLGSMSWDDTWCRMRALMDAAAGGDAVSTAATGAEPGRTGPEGPRPAL